MLNILHDINLHSKECLEMGLLGNGSPKSVSSLSCAQWLELKSGEVPNIAT